MPEGKRPTDRPRHRLEDNIKMDLTESGFGGWIGFLWLRIGAMAGSCEHGNESSGSIKCSIFLVSSQELCGMELVTHY
jgi:hypothetical protein